MNKSYAYPQLYRSDEAAGGSAPADPTAQVNEPNNPDVPSPSQARQQRVDGFLAHVPPENISDPLRSGEAQAGGAEGQELVERFNEMLSGPQPDNIPDLPGPSRAVPPAPNEGGK